MSFDLGYPPKVALWRIADQTNSIVNAVIIIPVNQNYAASSTENAMLMPIFATSTAAERT